MARTRQAGRLAAAVTALIIAAGCGLGGNDEQATDLAAATPSVTPSAEPTVEPTPSETTPAPSTSPSRKLTTKPTTKVTTKATTEPTEDPNNFQPPACSERDGKLIAKGKAKSALHAAAGKVYWPGSAPKLKVPVRLIVATAWHESGWQSNIVNCDGGYGLMQVMPATVSFVNQRFEQSYDVRDPQQNAYLGANYLAWLTKKFGDNYFKGSYDLSAGKCRSATDMCLLNMVIAAYNAGDGSVEQSYDSKELPNPDYVRVVRALMKSCFCDKY